ncbi:hypothetical protein [Aromatoleum diolicum]|uniref:Uncharacterized protein n=1 Tax=Aromatoleum diolicum TaxID=75796 RepID=A0ABX1QEK3_9RHOO|nr:hypothetical protein [Aromatoleum diolicum]NMG75826.1 hypothetical protein [Aromatoleum diolicum]
MEREDTIFQPRDAACAGRVPGRVNIRRCGMPDAPGGSESRKEELHRRLWQDAGLGEPAPGAGGRAPGGRLRSAATTR